MRLNCFWWDIRMCRKALYCHYSLVHSDQVCNVMAEGFRFMPLSLVRLRTFRLSTCDRVRVMSRTGSAQRLVENWKKVRELKAVVKTGALKVLEADPLYPSLLQPICCDKRVSNNQFSHTPRHHQWEGIGRTRQKWTFWITAIIAELKRLLYCFPFPSSFSFSVDFFLYSTKRWSYGTGVVVPIGVPFMDRIGIFLNYSIMLTA